jgi:hypothetical protein
MGSYNKSPSEDFVCVDRKKEYWVNTLTSSVSICLSGIKTEEIYNQCEKKCGTKTRLTIYFVVEGLVIHNESNEKKLAIGGYEFKITKTNRSPCAVYSSLINKHVGGIKMPNRSFFRIDIENCNIVSSNCASKELMLKNIDKHNEITKVLEDYLLSFSIYSNRKAHIISSFYHVEDEILNKIIERSEITYEGNAFSIYTNPALFIDNADIHKRILEIQKKYIDTGESKKVIIRKKLKDILNTENTEESRLIDFCTILEVAFDIPKLLEGKNKEIQKRYSRLNNADFNEENKTLLSDMYMSRNHVIHEGEVKDIKYDAKKMTKIYEIIIKILLRI